MKIKLLITLSLCIFLTWSNSKVISGLAATQDEEEIKNVIQQFLLGYASNDLNSALQLISINYLYEKTNIDYAKFKSIIEKDMSGFSKNYVDHTINDISILNMDIKDDKATVEVEYTWKGFNLDLCQEESKKEKRLVDLHKEESIWKITRWLKQ